MRTQNRYRRAIRELGDWNPGRGRAAAPAVVVTSLGRPRPVRTWLTTSAVVAVGLVGLVSLVPSRPAYGVDQVAQALQDAPNVHIVWTGPTGALIQEMWVGGKKRRYRFAHDFKTRYESTGLASANYISDRGFDGKRVWAINPGKHSASIATEPPEGFGWTDAPTVESIAEEFRKFAKGEVTKTTSSGGGVDVMTFTDQKAGWRLILKAEGGKNRPLSTEFSARQKSGTWKRTSACDYDYPESFDQDTFAFHPPSDYAVYDYDEIIASFDQGASGGGMKQTVDGVTIKVAGAFREEDGTVFVVWTGGACPPPLAKAGAFETDGSSRPTDSLTEDDDRNRPKNHGVAPKSKPKPVPRDQVVQTVRPLGVRKGVPFYGLRVFMPGTTFFEKESGPSKTPVPNVPVGLKVVLPVCKPVPSRVFRPGGKWIKFKVDGQQVGTATFDVTARPIDRFWRLLKLLDPAHSPSMGAVPLSKVQKP